MSNTSNYRSTTNWLFAMLFVVFGNINMFLIILFARNTNRQTIIKTKFIQL